MNTLFTDDQRWQLVLRRDSRADGQFVTAVRSTGIYCRPSCPAKHALRKNVAFFLSPTEAERAGFRPCRRCHPRDANADAQVKPIQRLCRYIETHLDQPLTLTELSQQVHLSPHHLQRTFKRVMGVSPRQYVEACRAAQLKQQLKESGTVTNAIYNAGYRSSSRLYEQTRLGMTPTIYRRGGAGMKMRYPIVDCALGRLLVAATEKGVCFVSLSDSDAALEAALSGDYHAAEIQRDDAGLRQQVSVVLKHLAGKQPSPDLPLDIQGTAFQRQVWEALRAIPYGQTRTYGEIAEAIGKPGAARAVGHACGANPVALVIPCHRAVGSTGQLTGYRWGVERKEKLLAQEARRAKSHA
jgi:AraC family transcriptional regulator of adaptative response/methylated-DNA-[protein]-cysteine methyltransferase